jgi:phosphatidylserine/phosphatidylglycerophosphate/cardiolipin synthase-like enzyme
MQDENIDRIAGIFDRAQTKVVGETENIGAPDVLNSIINAAKRGVEVDLVIPGNSLGNVAKNSQAVSQLEAASADIEKQGLPGIHIKEMPPIGNGGQSLPNPDQPYVHAKWLVADENKEAYLGSVNFTPNSLYAAREIGLIFEDSPTMQKMVTAFNKDWNAAQLPPDQQN